MDFMKVIKWILAISFGLFVLYTIAVFAFVSCQEKNTEIKLFGTQNVPDNRAE